MNIDAETYETGPGRPFAKRCEVCGAFHAGRLPDDRQHRLAVIHGMPFWFKRATTARFWDHRTVSYLKSAVRIIACVLSTLMPTWQAAVVTLALGLAGAEWLGVWEEMGGRG